MTKRSPPPNSLSVLAAYLAAFILVALPFHALVSTWAGSNFGHPDVWRIWKELLMVPLGLYAGWLVARQPAIRRRLQPRGLVWAIAAYTGLFMVTAVVALGQHRVSASAVEYSLVTNLRFLWFMLVVWVVSLANPLIRQQWAKLVLVPASLAIGFGLLQKLVLPADFLRHFGYRPGIIDPIETVDQKLDFRRIQSSLRGANPLGAYLVLVLTAAAAYVRKQPWLWLLLAAGGLVMFWSYSRSAWVGLVVSLGCLGWLTAKSNKLRNWFLIGGVVLGLVLIGLTWALRHNDTVQNTVFHSDETSQSSASSNAQRAGALRDGLNDVVSQPLGQGPGTAGPASVRNHGQARIAENYFLQIGQEVGWLGLGLFILINLLVARELWRRTTPLARVLLASLVGLTLVNLVSHAWTDDTLSLLWWGLAGAALSAPALANLSD